MDKAICVWEGVVDRSIALGANFEAASGLRYRIVIDEDEALFIERGSQDKLGHSAWVDIEDDILSSNVNENKTLKAQRDNAILTQAVYDMAGFKNVDQWAEIRQRSRLGQTNDR